MGFIKLPEYSMMGGPTSKRIWSHSEEGIRHDAY